MVDPMTFTGKSFSFHILDENNQTVLAFRSDSHKPTTNKEELRKLAISILNHLEKNDAN